MITWSLRRRLWPKSGQDPAASRCLPADTSLKPVPKRRSPETAVFNRSTTMETPSFATFSKTLALVATSAPRLYCAMSGSASSSSDWWRPETPDGTYVSLTYRGATTRRKNEEPIISLGTFQEARPDDLVYDIHFLYKKCIGLIIRLYISIY